MRKDYKQVQFTEPITESRGSSANATNSDSDSDGNLVDIDVHRQQKTSQCVKILALMAPFVFFAFVAVAVIVPVVVATVAQTINRDCELVAQNMSLPSVNQTLWFTQKIDKLYVVIPDSSIAQRHHVEIGPSFDDRIHLFTLMRALDKKYFPLLTLNTSIIGTTLNITFVNQLSWPGYGCPLITMKLQIPIGVAYEYVYISNLHNGTIMIDSLKAKVFDLHSGNGLIDVSKTISNILNATLLENVGNINIKQSKCVHVLNSTINAIGGEIRMNGIDSCGIINAITGTSPINMDQIAMSNGKLKANSNFGNVTLNHVSGLQTARVESKSGFINLYVTDPMKSTYFYVYSGEKASVHGFDKIEYDVDLIKEKSGRLYCPIKELCEKNVYIQTDSIGTAKFVKL